MTKEEVRALIVEALEYAGVFELRNKGLVQAFLEGSKDVSLADLKMDSLATMELCIAIEVNINISILPTGLEKLQTLNQLVAEVVNQKSGNSAVRQHVRETGTPRQHGTKMAALYARLKAGCPTVNQLNRVRVQLENRITPLDLESLAMSAKDPKDKDWLEALRAECTRSGKRNPERFVRRRLRRNISIYETGGCRSGKTIALCFSGHAQRMMMPIPVFLQHIDGNNVDVLLLRDPTKSGYRGGIEGVGGDIESVADEIDELAQIGEYRSAVAIGVSGGGLPAVITAVRLSLNSVLSVGGNSPFDPRWVQPDGKGAADILLRNIKTATRHPMVMLAFGSGSEVDMKAAEALRGILSAELIRIGDDVNRVGHVALDPLVKSGTFGDFLKSTVF